MLKCRASNNKLEMLKHAGNGEKQEMWWQMVKNMGCGENGENVKMVKGGEMLKIQIVLKMH